MNMTSEQTNTLKSVFMISAIAICLLAIPFGSIAVLVLSDLTYIVPSTLAIISFTLSVILSIRQKSLSAFSIIAFLVGVLFLASSVIDFGFSRFTQNMSAHDRFVFSGIIRPNQVSQGLASIGIGIALISVGLRNISAKTLEESNGQLQKLKPISLFQIGVGILFLLLGIFGSFGGLQPL